MSIDTGRTITILQFKAIIWFIVEIKVYAGDCIRLINITKGHITRITIPECALICQIPELEIVQQYDSLIINGLGGLPRPLHIQLVNSIINRCIDILTME